MRGRAIVKMGMIAVALTACEEPERAEPAAGGDAGAGEALVARHGCGTCHTIPGVPGATANVGPTLQYVARQSYIAGVLPNQPDNLVRWIMDPQAIDTRSAMPNLGVSEPEARDIAAFLYTLEGAER